MTGFPINEVLTALEGLGPYRVRADFGGRMRVAGVLDPRERRGAVRLGLQGRDEAEVVWREDQALGHRLGVARWLRVRDVPPRYVLPPDPELVRRAAEAGAVEEELEWVLRVPDAPAPIRDDAYAFLLGLLGPPKYGQEERRRQMAQQLADERVDVELRFARRDPRIMQIVVRRLQEERPVMRVAIEPTSQPIPLPPDPAGVPAESVPFSALLLHLPSIGGWAQRVCHARWAQRSLDLLAKVGDDRYADLYAAGWSTKSYDDAALGANPSDAHHPIVAGAFHEDESTMPPFYAAWFSTDAAYAADPDFYWKQAGYCRDYNHFGAEGIGLEDRWYFSLRPGCPSYAQDLVNGRFYSARDWGYGGVRIDESLNRLTFVRAIEQYNTYSSDGKRRAYLMLGHVVHLLQDQGQPDHARLVAHPGSSMDEVEAYGAYNYCEFLALEAAAAAALACWGPWAFACAAVAFGVAEGACWASASSAVVGFERLIGAPIEGITHWRLSDVDAAIDSLGVMSDPPSTYDGFFKTIGDLATSEATNRGLASALGCETLALIPPIPDADPAIDTTSADPAPYLALTKALVPKIVGLSAGLIRHFYDIVNHPPILERLTVVQWQPGARPLEFGVLDRTAPDHCTRYDGRWVMGAGQRALKMLHPVQALSLDRPAYVFLLFGPLKAGDVPEVGRLMSRVECLVSGRNLSTGTTFREPLRLEGAVDPTLGFYYWGSFQPHNCAPDPYQVTFEVSGEDAAAHLSGRPGKALDADPATPATVDQNDPQFGWQDYGVGSDQHHAVMVSAAIWRVDSSPQPLTLSGRTRRNRVGTFDVRVSERQLDCNDEPYHALTRCPVKWTLRQMVTDVTSGLAHPAEDLGLALELQVGHDQAATITVEVTDRYQPAHRIDRFQIVVDHTIGEGGYLVSGASTLDLEVR